MRNPDLWASSRVSSFCWPSRSRRSYSLLGQRYDNQVLIEA
jgi:hypothetical protein